MALLCVEDNPSDRPNISVVISMLTSEAVHLPMPKQPAFSSTGRRLLDDNLISDSTIQNQSRNSTGNNLTISVMDA